MNPNDPTLDPWKKSMSAILASEPSYYPNEHRNLENMIYRRISGISVEQLMRAAQHKELLESNSLKKFHVGPHSFKRLFLDLSDLQNNQILRQAAMIVLRNTKPGVSIEQMVNKVVVLCTVLSEPALNSHLDIHLIMRSINSVSNRYNSDSLVEIMKSCRNLLVGLNRAAISRAAAAVAVPAVSSSHNASMAAAAAWEASNTQPMKEVDGGFYKNNYRRSIKTRKSRKLRSRR
jgi:hypothetical protein